MEGFIKKINGVYPVTVIDAVKMGDGTGRSLKDRLSTLTATDYDTWVKTVNHRGYSDVAPENTLEAYRLSKKMGYTYVEADVSFTSDGVAVLLHDSTVDRTSDGSGKISEMTFDEVRSLDFGSWKSLEYEGVQIPTFKEFIVLCRNIGLKPYIELKSNGEYTIEQIRGLVDTVKRCGMDGAVTWISFNSDFLAIIKDHSPGARIGYLATPTVTSITVANSLKTGENEVFFDTSYANITEEAISLCIENDIALEAWTVNDAEALMLLDPYVSGITSDTLMAGKILYDAYID